jgi:queuosine precursor transporter
MMDRRLIFFLVLMSLHTSLLITSTIAGAKIFALPFGLSASATVISYMLTFVMLDAIAEIYGNQYSRFVIYIGLVGMALSAVYFEFAILLPPAASWGNQPALESILGSSWRVWTGGWLAYVLSQNFDLWSFLKLKQTPFKSVAVRAWVSMVVGQLLDTIVFMVIAFYGTLPLAPAIVGQYLIKLAFATVATPLVSLVVLAGRRFIRFS